MNGFCLNVLFTGLPALKQKKDTYEHKNLLKIEIISTIADTYDGYVRETKICNKTPF